MEKPKKTAGEMYPLIEKYLEGHLTQKVFSSKYGITESVLNYWLAKYRKQKENTTDSFIEITPSSPHADQAFLEVVYPHGIRLRFFSPVDPLYLDRLVAGR